MAGQVRRAGVRGTDPCPCGSGQTFARCCGPLLDGQAAPSAQALMRSRYTAFATGDEDYLFCTWHPRTRPDGPYCHAGTEWTGLTVLETVGGGADARDGAEAIVEFVARYRAWAGPWGTQGSAGNGTRVVEDELHERSRFVRRAGRWLYVDGTALGDV